MRQFQNKELIKVVTGIRRSGKSTLFQQFQEELRSQGIAEEQIISINFEDLAYEDLKDYRVLHSYLSARLVAGKMTYIFLDEIQEVPEFQRAVDSLYPEECRPLFDRLQRSYLVW